MIININWVLFQTKYLTTNRIFIIENDADWTLYTSDDIFVIKCVVEKYADQTENIMFVERYLTHPGIMKILSISETDEEKEEFPEEFFEIDKEDSEGEIVEELIEQKTDKKTSTDAKHYHYYYLDSEGNGNTIYTYPEEYIAHTHIIEDNKILDYNGHIHTYGN